MWCSLSQFCLVPLHCTGFVLSIVTWLHCLLHFNSKINYTIAFILRVSYTLQATLTMRVMYNSNNIIISFRMLIVIMLIIMVGVIIEIVLYIICNVMGVCKLPYKLVCRIVMQYVVMSRLTVCSASAKMR